MYELILQAQKAIDEDNFEEYAKLQVKIRNKYLQEENDNMYKLRIKS